MIMQSSIVAPVHLLHPIWAHGLNNQQAKKFINSLAISFQGLLRQEAKYRIYYLHDDDLGNAFLWIKRLG